MMKRLRVLMALMASVVFGLSAAGTAAAGATALAAAEPLGWQITPRYDYTNDIYADLSFSGSKANCHGAVTPSGNDAVTVTVTLYRQEGSGWAYVDSWSGSASGGGTASAGSSATVGKGTYKVTVKGNVGGKEFPSKSVTRTK